MGKKNSSSKDTSVNSQGNIKNSESDFSGDEEDLIERLYNLLGHRWSLIAGRLPGRTAQRLRTIGKNGIRVNRPRFATWAFICK